MRILRALLALLRPRPDPEAERGADAAERYMRARGL